VFKNKDMQQEIPKKLIATIMMVVLLVIIMFKSSVTIKSGEAGVLFETFGGGVNTENTIEEGFTFMAPWNDMFIYNVRQQAKKEIMPDVLSSDGLGITIEITLQFQPLYESLAMLHKTKGLSYVDQIVTPAIRSATRTVIGRYTPEEIYSTKKEAIQTEIFDETYKICIKEYVQINAVLVRDIKLPKRIQEAIQFKLEQEQEFLQYEYKLQTEKKEAERIKIEAEGKAEANRILNASLTPNILKEKGIQATLELAKSTGSKTVIIGGSDGLPLILGGK